jgi:hypothetical protein
MFHFLVGTEMTLSLTRLVQQLHYHMGMFPVRWQCDGVVLEFCSWHGEICAWLEQESEFDEIKGEAEATFLICFLTAAAEITIST